MIRCVDLLAVAIVFGGIGACGGGEAAQAMPTATPKPEVTTTIRPTVHISVTPALAPILAPVKAAPAATAPTVAALAMDGLAFHPAAVVDTAAWVTPTSTCRLAVALPAELGSQAAQALTPDSGVFFDESERAVWQQRITAGPFRDLGDYAARSPGDWRRITDNAMRFIALGEPLPSAVDDGAARARHGSTARDAAFHHLMTGDARSLAAVRAYLLVQAASAENDFSRLCVVTADGSTLDARFWHASWLLRYLATYDFVRAHLSASERSSIETSIRRNAYALASHIDWGNAQLFPNRLQGDYSQRAQDAAPSTDAQTWWAKRYDTSGDCKVSADDRSEKLPAYAYARADGSAGPRLTALSQWFNNRKSASAAAFGAAGVLLGDATLVNHAKRYFMEWLAYGVWPDGSEGEYARNGDYCIAQQGVIYATTNLQGALLLSRALARQGDLTLAQFQTPLGLFGSQSGSGQPNKSLALVAQTHVALRTGRLAWFAHEPWRAAQAPRAATSLGAAQSHYLGGSSAVDNYHELGLLMAAPWLPGVPISGLVLRDPAVTSLAFPGATGNAVATGFGDWTDVFNAMPAVLLLRP